MKASVFRRAISTISLFFVIPLSSEANPVSPAQDLQCSYHLDQMRNAGESWAENHTLPVFAFDPKTKEVAFEIRQLDREHLMVLGPQGMQVFNIQKVFKETEPVYVQNGKFSKMNITGFEDGVLQRRKFKLPDGSDYILELPYDNKSDSYLDSAWLASKRDVEFRRVDFEKEIAYLDGKLLSIKGAEKQKQLEYQDACNQLKNSTDRLLLSFFKAILGSSEMEQKQLRVEVTRESLGDMQKSLSELETQKKNFVEAQKKDKARREKVDARQPSLISVMASPEQEQLASAQLKSSLEKDFKEALEKKDYRKKKKALAAISACQHFSSPPALDLENYQKEFAEWADVAETATPAEVAEKDNFLEKVLKETEKNAQERFGLSPPKK